MASKKLSAKSEKMIAQLVACTCGVLERLVELCRIDTLEDGMVCTLSSIGASLFFADGVGLEVLQLTGIELLCTVSARLPQHRSMILEDVFRCARIAFRRQTKRACVAFLRWPGLSSLLLLLCLGQLLLEAPDQLEAEHPSICAHASPFHPDGLCTGSAAATIVHASTSGFQCAA